MTRSCMPDQTSARWVVLRLGGAMLLIAASAGAWEVLASQAPGSPLYLGVLPGPIERLRHEAFDFGVLCMIAGLLLGETSVPRRVLLWLGIGAVLALSASLYAALTGMTGVQMADLRPDAGWLFATKLLGRALLCAGLASIALQTLRKPPNQR
jgi:hypothetical protein